MRRSLCLVLGLGLAVAAYANPVWTTPGWYQVADTIDGLFVLKGPFPDDASCRETLPANEIEADYACTYLSERPDYDE